ncbi:MAG: hypothetical protein LBP21_06385 [Synergistaceae bacterium]|jgi:hypothetical protein|nr:hypothetical protein [Synergistaceae bacterium]
MSKKNKKKLQQNLSLKERLEKHWNNRNWFAFVSLFTRDREASMRTPWASRWDDALYNCLTSALFLEKDFKNVEMTLDLIRAEGGKGGVSPLLCDCADVASDFMRARESGVVSKPSKLLAETNLPSPYLALRRDLASAASSKRKKSSSETEALVKKLAAQYGRLSRAKTATPYRTWLKIAQELEETTQDMEGGDVFRAVRLIVALVLKLFITGKGENSLREPISLLQDVDFRKLPPNQTHPVVRTLWEFFCRAGEGKYGRDWGDTVRVLQFAFIKPATPDLEQLKAQYDRLVKMRNNAFLEDVLQSALLTRASRWTDQENYVLRAFFVRSFKGYDDKEPEVPELLRLLEAFKILGEIGRKWRPQAPWTEEIYTCFEDVVFNLPRKLVPTYLQGNLPYESMTAATLFYLSLIAPYNKEPKEQLASRPSLRLSAEEMNYAAEALLPEDPSPKEVRAAKGILGDGEYVAFCEELVRTAIKFSAENIVNNDDLSQLFWFFLRRDLVEELANSLSPGSLEECFCRLYLDAKPMSLSKDPVKIEAFFKGKSSSPEFGPLLWIVLLRWPEVEADFLVRLFEKNYAQTQEEARTQKDIWEMIGRMIARIKPKAKRDMVTQGVCRVMAKDKKNSNPYFKKTLTFLKSLPAMTDAEVAQKEARFARLQQEMSAIEAMREAFFKAFHGSSFYDGDKD